MFLFRKDIDELKQFANLLVSYIFVATATRLCFLSNFVIFVSRNYYSFLLYSPFLFI